VLEWDLLHGFRGHPRRPNIHHTGNTSKGPNMASNRLGRRISAAVGGAAILAMIGFTAACSSESEKAPETSTTTTTTTEASLTPTEKKPNPNGTNIFTPPVVAPEQTVNPSNR
jgi:hypothetical protein